VTDMNNASNLSLLLDVNLPLTVSFGHTFLPIRDILRLSAGSVIELDCAANDPVEVIVNNCTIARGSVVVIDGNYGVRIDEIISRQDRLLLQPKEGGNGDSSVAGNGTQRPGAATEE
jgi:flagellar motor switch protein FliN